MIQNRSAPPESISDELINTICDRLAENKRVRRFLPNNGRIHVDRQLPFLCALRVPSDNSGAGTERLVTGQAAHLIAPDDDRYLPDVQRLVHRLAFLLSDIFGAFLLVEIWPADPTGLTDDRHTIRIFTEKHRSGDRPVIIEKLEKALGSIQVPFVDFDIEVAADNGWSPPGKRPLLLDNGDEVEAILPVGLEIPPIYRDPESGALYPETLRSFQRELSDALQRTFFDFMQMQTTFRPKNYHVLGRKAVLRAVWDADEQLAAIDEMFDFLLEITPINSAAAWKEFCENQFERSPAFRYRLLSFDPAALKRKLYSIDLDPLEDPALVDLLRDKRNELDLQLTMLENRHSPRFLLGSMQLFGTIGDDLLKLARELLTLPPGSDPDERQEDAVDATAFARRAAEEIRNYRKKHAALTPSVKIRGDISSMMVSRGDLLVARNASIPASRVEALIQHEVGTHILTYYNGKAQPLRLLYCGLPGYEELQEGLAVLAEYMVDGLSLSRVRLLAARVVAADSCVEGATFTETFRMLSRDFGFAARTAFDVTTRVYRGGGYVKDIVYLRGLMKLLRYLREGGDFTPLWVGKIGFSNIKIIEELLWREVLKSPPLQPTYLMTEMAMGKITDLRSGLSVLDLIQKE